MITSFKQIKAIIEPIPANKFQVGTYGHDPRRRFGPNKGLEDNGCSCIFGHINRHFIPELKGYGSEEAFGARELTRRFFQEFHNTGCTDASNVNNRPNINGYYNQPKIKDRLMAMIEDGIKWEESKQK